MDFCIREANTEADFTDFIRQSYETAKSVEAEFLMKIINDNPDKTEEEIIALYRAETEEYMDFGKEYCKVFLIEDETGVFAGFIWVAIRDSEDIWDFERPLWIYDINVLPDFRRKGLGSMLLQRAEEFARELGRNIGLFVHATNEGARNLYKSEGYYTRIVPVSLKFDTDDVVTESAAIDVRDSTSISEKLVSLGMRKFKSIVQDEGDFDTKTIEERYRKYIAQYAADDTHQIYVAEENDDLIGFVWVGQASFNEKIAMVYELVISEIESNDAGVTSLLKRAEIWSRNNEYSVLYILLHTDADISLDLCKKLGFRVPGYFMFKKLK